MPNVPTVTVFTDTTLTADDINDGIGDALNFLLKVPTAQLRQTTLQTLTTGVGAAVSFQTEDIDSDVDGTGGHSTVTNVSRYTVRYPGIYFLAGGNGFAANATGRRGGWWAKNGSAVNGSQVAGPATAANDREIAQRGMHVSAVEGDYFESFAYQDSGGNLNTIATAQPGSSAAIRWVSAT